MSQIINPLTINSGGGISGGLNFGAASAGGNLFQGTAEGSNFGKAYQGALAGNTDLYTNTMGLYNQTLAGQTSAQQAQLGAWNGLYNNIMGMLGVGGSGSAVGSGGTVDMSKVDLTKGAAGVTPGSFGVATPAAQAIANTLVSNQGAVNQQMQSAGLAGTTAYGNAQNQQLFQANQAIGGLGASLAQTAAGYATNLGEATLNYANQANMQNTAERNLAAEFMGKTSIPYPSSAAYGSVLQYLNPRGGAGAGGQAVVNPFGSPSAGSQGHTGFISGQGNAGGGTATPPPQQTGYGMFANQIANGLAGANTVGFGTLSPQQISEMISFGNDYSSAAAANQAANSTTGQDQITGYDEFGQPIYQNSGGGQYQSPEFTTFD